jgi:hypothetical protein
MSEALVTSSIVAPGFYGLNTQESSIELNNGYALQAFNVVIDKSGRVGARKGWKPRHSTLAALGSNPVKGIYELIGTDGTKYVVAVGNNKLFKLVGTALTQLTYGGGGTAPVITADHWSITSLNNKVYFFQADHDPLVFDPAVSTTTYRRVSELSGYLGTVAQADIAISAYGRLWTASTSTDKQTIKFCDLIDGANWQTGTAGTLNVSTIWTNGTDEITGLAAHNGFLIIFGRRQVLIYQGAQDPNTMSLADSINGIGCVAKHSIQSISTDVLFLSDSGIRSFARTVQEKSLPMRDISKNVRDDLLALLEGEDLKNVRAAYNEKEAFYIISFPSSEITYCFDMRAPLPEGAAKPTMWTLAPTALFSASDRMLLMGLPGYVAEYDGYLDNTSSYFFSYFGNYIDFGAPTTEKILKKIGFTMIGGINQPVAVKWGFDYADNYRTETVLLSNQAIYEYGVSEYGLAEYAGGIDIDQKRVNAHGRGKVLQFGFETEITGKPISIQKIDVYVKQGRIV